MQRIACHEYALEQGWTIIREVYEKGISGYKVKTDNRDAIQELKEKHC
jgi:Resolvase, N terminal domain.